MSNDNGENPPLPTSLTGFLDNVTPSGMVEGWAWYPATPSRRAEIEIFADGQLIGVVIAERPRSDLAAAKLGDGQYGFSWPLPGTYLTRPGQLTITAREVGSSVFLSKSIQFTLSPVQAQLNLAEQLMTDSPAKAEAALTRALALVPDNLPARLSLARMLRQRGNHVSALAQFQAAARLAPRDVWRWLDVADEFRALERLDEAEDALRQALARQARNIHVRIGFARCARARGNHAAALVHFKLAANLAPGDVWRWLDLAEELRAFNRLDEAEDALRHALRLNPAQAQALLGLGHCARARGETSSAIRYFTEATTLDGGDPWPRLELAQSQRDAGDFAAARATAQDLLASSPEDPRALFSLGRTAQLAGNHTEAASWFRHVLAVEPSHLWALSELATEEYVLGHIEESETLLTNALEIDPAHPGVVTGLARLARVTGDLDNVHRIYQDASLSNPAELTFQFGLADVLAALGRTEEAVVLLDALEKSHTPRANISAKRVALLRAAGQLHEARAVARAATAIFSADFYLWVERFFAELAFGDDAELTVCLQAMPASTLRERAVQARCTGALAEKNWQLATALAHYERAASLFGDDVGLQEDLVRVKLLLIDCGGARENLRRYCILQATDRWLRGESQNISQTILGQILDEYALDRSLADALLNMQALPSHARVKPLCDIVHANPHHTPAAISLLVALRQSGLLTFRLPPSPGPAIPKIIYKYWDAENPPVDVQELMKSWCTINPDYELVLFNNSSADAFLAANQLPAVRMAYNRVREPAQKADIFRLALLALEGGVYSDADDRCLAPLATIIPPTASLVLFQENLGSVANNFIAVAPRHPVIVSALEAVVTAVNRGDADTIWLLSGPGLITRALAQHITGQASAVLWPEATALLTLQELHQAVAEHCRTAYKNRNHHWANASFNRGGKRLKIAAPTPRAGQMAPKM